MAVTPVAVLAFLAAVGSLEAIVLPRAAPVTLQEPTGTSCFLGLLDNCDPFTLSDQTFDLTLKEITAKGGLKNVVITGGSGLKLHELTLKEIANGKASVGLTIPTINVAGQYDVAGTLRQSGLQLPLDGEGDFTVGFSDFTADATVVMGISDKGQILLDDFQLSWNMNNLQIKLDGLFGGQALGNIINKILHDALPHLVQVYHEQITDLITKSVKGMGSEYLKGMHQDHGEPALQGGRFVVGDVAGMSSPSLLEHLGPLFLRNDRNVQKDQDVHAELQDDGNRRAGLVGTSENQPGLLSLFGLDSDETSADGLFKLHLAEPQIFNHGELSADSGESSDVDVKHINLLSLFGLDSDETSADDLFKLHLAKPQIFNHGELSADSGESSDVDVKHINLLSLFGLVSDETSTDGLFKLHLAKPQIFNHGELSADSADHGKNEVSDKQTEDDVSDEDCGEDSDEDSDEDSGEDSDEDTYNKRAF